MSEMRVTVNPVESLEESFESLDSLDELVPKHKRTDSKSKKKKKTA